MSKSKYKNWFIPMLIISFILYNIGVPLFVHFCASKNVTNTHIVHKKDLCKDKKTPITENKKSCCNKKKNNPIPKESNNCYGEYFAPSDCCKLTYQIKQNQHKYLAEHSKAIKKSTPCTVITFHRYLAGIPLPDNRKNNKKSASSKSLSPQVPLIEYFPLRL